MTTSELVEGKTYFRLTLADREFTMPGVDPIVYVGTFEDDSGLRYAFQDTVSFVRFGSVRFGSVLDTNDPNDELEMESMGAEEIESDIFSIDAIAAEVSAAARRAAERGYPVLRVLKKGWESAS